MHYPTRERCPAEIFSRFVPLVSSQDGEWFDKDKASALLCRQFGLVYPGDFVCSDMPEGIAAAGAALHMHRRPSLIRLHTQVPLPGISSLIYGPWTRSHSATWRSYQISGDRSEEGTLVGIIDLTETPMGKRLIRRWITAPLRSVRAIGRRLDAVEYGISSSVIRMDIRSIIHRFADIERIAGRISYGNASPRDLVTLTTALQAADQVRSLLSGQVLPEALQEAADTYLISAGSLSLIQRAIVDEPPALIRKGGVISGWIHEELDRLRIISRDGRQWIADLEQQEKEKTGIKSLKIRYNAVFGYFIEITKANLSSVPPEYERRQTTANGERFTIPVLRDVESQIATADERLQSLEEELYTGLLTGLKQEVPELQQTGHAIGSIDLYLGLAEAALKFRYVRPQLVDEPSLLIRGGRHPVVEASIPGGFVRTMLR